MFHPLITILWSNHLATPTVELKEADWLRAVSWQPVASLLYLVLAGQNVAYVAYEKSFKSEIYASVIMVQEFGI